MAIFKGKSEEEKAAELAAQETARRDEVARDAAREEERLKAEFAASPAGQAQAAKAAGRRYFQIVRDVSTTSGSATWAGNVSAGGHTDQTGLIESIEDQGWALQDAGYVFQETASDSKSKALGSGERTAISGKIVGIYLFRATPTSV
ncbi:MAG: hypothetical protein QOG21_562 [Actinomycetota bacterium]|jgi:hypothetical protein|nr:hypothetical protein [Actinomycetota bacterium]